MPKTLGELESLEKKQVIAPKSQKKDPVAEFKRMEGIKRGLPKGLRERVEKRGVKNVQALKVVARQAVLRKKNESIKGLPKGAVKPKKQSVEKAPQYKVDRKIVKKAKRAVARLRL